MLSVLNVSKGKRQSLNLFTKQYEHVRALDNAVLNPHAYGICQTERFVFLMTTCQCPSTSNSNSNDSTIVLPGSPMSASMEPPRLFLLLFDTMRKIFFTQWSHLVGLQQTVKGKPGKAAQGKPSHHWNSNWDCAVLNNRCAIKLESQGGEQEIKRQKGKEGEEETEREMEKYRERERVHNW